MSNSVLNEQDYYRIVYGGWLGKNIGGTLGAPVEGVKEKLNLTFYPKLPDGPLENDDLDLQLVWLHALEQYGPGLTSKELGQEWLDHIFFPFDEYGYALTSLRRGLLAPVTGSFNNPFNNCMGSPIRSEIWAMAAPGAPDVAAYYAYHDAVVDHAGGEGVYGEVFFAALESAIFYEQDRDRLIEIGLRYIPEHSRTALAMRDLIKWHREGYDWEQARELILQHHGRDNFTDAPQNIAFTILGWLYGDNFEDAILKAVNCGYDTDCTAATLGAILGMLLGPEQLPARWVNPVGDRVVVSPPIKGFPAPRNLDELTKRTMQVGKRVLAYWDTGITVLEQLPTAWADAAPTESNVETVHGSMQAHLHTELDIWRNCGMTANRYMLPQGTLADPDLELELDYGVEGPAIGIGQAKTIRITLTNRCRIVQEGVLQLELPTGLRAGSADRLDIQLQPGESVKWDAVVAHSTTEAATSYELAVRWTRDHDGHAWTSVRIPFSLVGATHWTVEGPASTEAADIICPGNRIDWALGLVSTAATEGAYRARTKLHNPSTRRVRLIVAANVPVKAKLDGKMIIDCPMALEFMPAYHRAPKQQYVELELSAGNHDLEVEAIGHGGELPEVYVLPVSTRETKSPGPYYYYTDMLFLPSTN